MNVNLFLYSFGFALFGVIGDKAEYALRHNGSWVLYFVTAAAILCLCLHYSPLKYASKRAWTNDVLWAVVATIGFIGFLWPVQYDPLGILP